MKRETCANFARARPPPGRAADPEQPTNPANNHKQMIAALKTTPSTAAAGDEQRALSPLTLFFSGRPLTDQERAREVADEWHHVPTEIKAYLTEMLKTTDTEATADEYWYNLTMQEQLELSWLYLDDTRSVREYQAPPPAAPEPVMSPYKPGPESSTGKADRPHDLDSGALAALPPRMLSFA